MMSKQIGFFFISEAANFNFLNQKDGFGFKLLLVLLRKIPT